MKNALLKSCYFLLFINSVFCFSQEWKNLKIYKKETGNLILKEGCWLKKDRTKNTTTWESANKFNLKNNAFSKYKTIHQIRDFYHFMQIELDKKGHEIKWTHAAFLVANQLSKLEIDFIRLVIVRNKEVVQFAHEGSKKVFEYSFPKLKELYFSKELLKESEAENWDKNQTVIEQCEILDPLYNNLSKKALKKLNRMAKGKGIYSLGVVKGIRYEGEIINCNTRYYYSINKLIPYCNSTK
ncbi:hypothetical protein BX611_2784 [Lutibacter oceani]|uniref:Uncharacterized protein n=1 Tax=Lutibacter oceani TaxID=1853311 RepID=A0A3D9RT66_9FLAO|nr:hypothetical protein BX611_2784 [Lutibacter oceani]